MEGTADFAGSSFFVEDGCDLEEIWVELQDGTSIFGLVDCVCGNLENETEAVIIQFVIAGSTKKTEKSRKITEIRPPPSLDTFPRKERKRIRSTKNQSVDRL